MRHFTVAKKPGPAFGMDRLALARWAFACAGWKLEADFRAGRISPGAAQDKFAALRGAYQLRQDNIKQAEFLNRALGARRAAA